MGVMLYEKMQYYIAMDGTETFQKGIDWLKLTYNLATSLYIHLIFHNSACTTILQSHS